MSSRASEPAIVVSRLCKAFAKRRELAEILRHPLVRAGSVTALQNIDLEVRHGEIFGLLGPNGAGKTTLLKILSCLVLPDSGRAVVNGRDAAREELAVKRSIGYVTSDERSFYWRLTGAQNLEFFARLHGLATDQINPLVTHLLERMELSDKRDAPFSSYSSGMKQRLSLARALLHDPPILFLDEPTRSLDPVTARHIRQLIRELSSREGKTILLATHNLNEAAFLCDRMAILSNARVRRVGRLDEFQALFAGERRYRLVTDRPVDLDGVARVLPETRADPNTGTGRVAVLLELDGSAGDDLSPLLTRLATADTRVLELTRVEPSLEDLFQHLFEEGRVDKAAGTGEAR